MFLKINLSENLLYFSKSSRLLKSFPSISISSNLPLVSYIHSSDFTFYSSLFLIPQIKSVAKSYFFHLSGIKQLKHILDNTTLKLKVILFIFSRFDYCKSLYHELPDTALHPLAKAFHGAVLLVSGTHEFFRLTPILISTSVGCLIKKISF